jgi:hypothetical protein
MHTGRRATIQTLSDLELSTTAQYRAAASRIVASKPATDADLQAAVAATGLNEQAMFYAVDDASDNEPASIYQPASSTERYHGDTASYQPLPLYSACNATASAR